MNSLQKIVVSFFLCILQVTVFCGCITPIPIPANIPPSPANPSGHIQEKMVGEPYPSLKVPEKKEYKEQGPTVQKRKCVEGVIDPECEWKK